MSKILHQSWRSTYLPTYLPVASQPPVHYSYYACCIRTLPFDKSFQSSCLEFCQLFQSNFPSLDTFSSSTAEATSTSPKHLKRTRTLCSTLLTVTDLLTWTMSTTKIKWKYSSGRGIHLMRFLTSRRYMKMLVPQFHVKIV